jgi:biopolymer transport protein ExbD
LIFFLLTSQFVVQTGVKVQLPGAKFNEQSTPSRLVVTITANEKYYFGQDETTIQELPGKLSEALKKAPEKNLIIRADKTVDIDLVIQVIDAAKGIGIDKFTIETEKDI